MDPALAVPSHRKVVVSGMSWIESTWKAGLNYEPVVVSYLKLITLGSIEY